MQKLQEKFGSMMTSPGGQLNASSASRYEKRRNARTDGRTDGRTDPLIEMR